MAGTDSFIPHGFLERPVTRDLSRCQLAILGVPYDLATTGRAGTRMGPDAIRHASWELSWEKRRWPWRFSLTERLEVIDYGNVEFATGDSAHMVRALQTHARDILATGKTLLSLGGDHFISLPLLREHAARHGRISLIHFDAHADTERIEGAFNHGNMFDRACSEGLIDPTHSVQIGIRTEYEYKDYPLTVLDAAWVNDHPAQETAEIIRRTVASTPAYLTFDIDCLDPAYAPGTGTPVAGGLTSDRALSILRNLVECNLVGMDVVEVSPAYDHAEITSLAAATIALELLYVFAARRSDLDETRPHSAGS